MTAQAPVKGRGRRPATRQVYPFYRRTTTGERVKVVKRWLCPRDPTFCTFYSVDAEDRFWQEKKGEYSPAEAPPELGEVEAGQDPGLAPSGPSGYPSPRQIQKRVRPRVAA